MNPIQRSHSLCELNNNLSKPSSSERYKLQPKRNGYTTVRCEYTYTAAGSTSVCGDEAS